MTLLSAFQTLLYRYTDQSDLLIGASDRTSTPAVSQPEHPLPLRISVAEGSTFLSLLSQVREVTLAAQAHQAAPYENVIKALEQGYSGDRQPHPKRLFQTQFLLSSTPYDTSDTKAHVSNPNQLAQTFSQSELSLHLYDRTVSPAASQDHNAELACAF